MCKSSQRQKRAKGVEPSTKPNNSSGNKAILETGGVKAAPLPSSPMPTDEDFLAVAMAWAKLPDAIRDGIVAMVRAILEK
ncbi:MAG: hypothetical protein ABSB33_01590 [Tepidisphaeraceae bacterium]|jgi:hypothetical protein